MNPLTRIQLMLLAVLAVLVVWRMTAPEPVPQGFLRLSDLNEKRLYERAFELEHATVVRIDVRGAFENDALDAPLAAYGWIVDARSGEPVWTMPAVRTGLRDILTTVQDQVDLEPGRYVAYYAALGPDSDSWDADSFLGLSPHWKHHREKFYMVLDADADVSLSSNTSVTLASAGNELWSVHGVGSRARETVIMKTESVTPVHIQATGEWCASGCDVARLRDLETGRDVWEMNMENSEHAGGWNANRTFSGMVVLDPGVYQAVFKTDRFQDADRWIANPPWVPAKWGMSLRTDAAGVTLVDPWSNAGLEPAVSLLQVSSGMHEEKAFKVDQSIMVLVHALGEIGTDGTLYDHAKITDSETGTVLWSMSLEESVQGGGHETNRAQSGVLRLTPGVYRLSYETDDSHAWNDWRKSRPRHPDRWGVALFVMESADSNVLSVVEESVAPSPSMSVEQRAGAVLVQAERVPNDMQILEEFTLNGASTIHIRASGEISRQGRYDYGWIESVASGDTVWEMTLDNTVHAGGDERNRIYDGALELRAGAYRVQYVTDFDYAWGDFDTAPPKYPDAWGITVTLK